MRSWERYAPLSGVVAVVLWVFGTFLLEKDDRPEGKDTAAFVAWVEKNDTAIITGAIVFGFGVIFFLWMLGSLRATLFAGRRRHRPAGDRRVRIGCRHRDLDDVHVSPAGPGRV